MNYSKEDYKSDLQKKDYVLWLKAIRLVVNKARNSGKFPHEIYGHSLFERIQSGEATSFSVREIGTDWTKESLHDLTNDVHLALLGESGIKSFSLRYEIILNKSTNEAAIKSGLYLAVERVLGYRIEKDAANRIYKRAKEILEEEPFEEFGNIPSGVLCVGKLAHGIKEHSELRALTRADLWNAVTRFQLIEKIQSREDNKINSKIYRTDGPGGLRQGVIDIALILKAALPARFIEMTFTDAEPTFVPRIDNRRREMGGGSGSDDYGEAEESERVFESEETLNSSFQNGNENTLQEWMSEVENKVFENVLEPQIAASAERVVEKLDNDEKVCLIANVYSWKLVDIAKHVKMVPQNVPHVVARAEKKMISAVSSEVDKCEDDQRDFLSLEIVRRAYSLLLSFLPMTDFPGEP